MTTTCNHCQKSFSNPANSNECPYCHKPLAAAAAALNFDDFFELTDNKPAMTADNEATHIEHVKPPSTIPSAPSAVEEFSEFMEEGAAVEATSVEAVPELPQTEPTTTEGSLNDELLGDFAELNNEATPTPAAPPPSKAAPPAAPASSLDADFEDLFQDEIAAPPPAKAAAAKQSPAVMHDPRREPEVLEELFQDPGAPPFAEPASKPTPKGRSISTAASQEDQDDLKALLAHDAPTKRPWFKRPQILIPIVFICSIAGMMSFTFFAPKKSVPGFLQGLRRLYHGGPSAKARETMRLRLVAMQEEIRIDASDTYNRIIAELQTMQQQDPEQYQAMALQIIIKTLADFGAIKENVNHPNLATLKALAAEDKPTLLPLALAYIALQQHNDSTLPSMFNQLGKDELSEFLQGEYYLAQHNITEATHHYQAASKFRRASLRLTQLACMQNPENANELWRQFIEQNPNYLLGQIYAWEYQLKKTNNRSELTSKINALLEQQALKLSPFEKSRLYFMLYDNTLATADMIKRAYELDSSNAEVAHAYARTIMLTDTEQALIILRKATSLDPDEMQYQASLAEAMRLKGDAENGLKLLQDAASKHPGNIAIQLELAQTLLALQQTAEAKSTIEKLLRLDPNNVPAKLIIAQIFISEKAVAAAIERLKEVIKSAPQDATAPLLLADALLMQGTIKLALQVLESSQSQNQANPMYYAKLAKIQGMLGQNQPALNSIQKSLNLDSSNKTLLFMAAETARSIKAYQEAIAPLKKLIELDDKNLDYRILLGRNYLDLNEPSNALEVFKDAISMKSDDYMIRHYLGVAYRQNKNYEPAVAELSKSLILNPDYKPSYFEIALAYDGMNDYANALKNLDILLKQDASHIRGTQLAADVYSKVGDFSKAVQYYQRSIKSNNKDWNSYIQLGNNYLKLGQTTDAAKAFLAAARLNPQAAEAYLGLGKFFEERNDTVKAISYYIKANRLDAKNSEAYYRLGYAYKVLGKRPQAIAAFRQYLVIEPDSQFKSVIEDELSDLEGR